MFSFPTVHHEQLVDGVHARVQGVRRHAQHLQRVRRPLRRVLRRPGRQLADVVRRGRVVRQHGRRDAERRQEDGRHHRGHRRCRRRGLRSFQHLHVEVKNDFFTMSNFILSFYPGTKSISELVGSQVLVTNEY